MTDAPWSKYAVGEKRPTPKWVEPSCRPLNQVMHVSHLGDALKIIEDEKIRSSLIWDESKLSNTRTLVSWVSPNTWGYGSIYGNICFTFDWLSMVKDKSIYWVEVMQFRKHTAYRFLITAKYDYSNYLEKYNPENDNGPIIKDGLQWYFNGEHACEIMIDDDLSLSECKQIDFVDHHPVYCAKYGYNACPDKDSMGRINGSVFLASVVGREKTSLIPKMVEIDDEGKTTVNTGADVALNYLWQVIEFNGVFNGPIQKENSINKLVDGFLLAWGQRQDDKALAIASFCTDKKFFTRALTARIKHFFNVDHMGLAERILQT